MEDSGDPKSIKQLILQAQDELPYQTGAFEELAEMYYNMLYAVCLRVTGDRYLADDAYQNTMLKIFRYLKSFKLESSFKTWIYRIAYNESITVIKQYKNDFDTIEFNDSIGKESSIDNEIEIENLLNRLDEADREILLMKYTVELSDKEIAEIMNLSLSAVKMRLSRAKQKLKNFFE